MYGLDLFSGIGGLTRALDGYVTPVAYCECNEYARAVLCRRMGAGDLPPAPIWDDVRTLSGYRLPPIDIIYGGFPCQDISGSGSGMGLDGKRSGLFSEICRLAEETKAEWVFLENVPNIRTKGLGRVVKRLADLGYDCRWGVISASSVGSPIKAGVRWFLLAKAASKGLQRLQHSQYNTPKPATPSWFQWQTEPSVARVANGIPDRVERTIALGNAVVPQQAREAFERLSGLKQG
jgi:DNA (cytosine-5)-methyltransferase 1